MTEEIEPILPMEVGVEEETVTQFVVFGVAGSVKAHNRYQVPLSKAHPPKEQTNSISGVSVSYHGDDGGRSSFLQVIGYNLAAAELQWDLASEFFSQFQINTDVVPAAGKAITPKDGIPVVLVDRKPSLPQTAPIPKIAYADDTPASIPIVDETEILDPVDEGRMPAEYYGRAENVTEVMEPLDEGPHA